MQNQRGPWRQLLVHCVTELRVNWLTFKKRELWWPDVGNHTFQGASDGSTVDHFILKRGIFNVPLFNCRTPILRFNKQ